VLIPLREHAGACVDVVADRLAAAGEDRVLAVNLGEVIVVYRPSKLGLRLVLQLPGQLFLLALKELGPSDVVERPALGDGCQPGARIVGYAGGRPLLEETSGR
jgi:hypothetical protein